MKLLRKPIASITIIAVAMAMCIAPIATSETYAATADPAYNKVVVPSTVNTGQTFTISASGHLETTLGETTGDTRFVFDYWTLDGPNLYYSYWYNENDYFENVTYPTYSGKKKLTMPGKYKLTTDFDKQTYDYNGGYDYWDTSLNEYPKVKYINVKGKVGFSISSKKGKLKKKSQKYRYILQKGKIGSLPKVKAKKGYKFKGWYTKKKGGKKIKSSTKVVFSKSSKVYYAQFKKK